MAEKIKTIVLKDKSKYYMIVDWAEVEEKPDLLTQAEIDAKGYLSKPKIKKLAQATLDNIPDYNGEVEEL